MLTKPVHGWSAFQLEGTSIYRLSDLDDIAFEWVEQAIRGLETMRPFCVKGFLEPHRFLCTVSYWNCHIVCEDDERAPLKPETVRNECSHTSMLQFCQALSKDVTQNLDEWAVFADHRSSHAATNREALLQRLTLLNQLILEKEECFGENSCFL